MIYSNKIFEVAYPSKGISPSLFSFLDDSGCNLVDIFGVSKLAEIEKIRIFILRKALFERERDLHFRKNATPDCVAFSSWRIVVESYNDLKKCYSDIAYCKLVLHECIHVLQRFTTKVPACDAVWLYEAVACYLAGQEKVVPLRNIRDIEWDSLKYAFYDVKDCYAIAYKLGKEFFTQFGTATALKMCADPELCEKYFQQYIDKLEDK